LDYGCVSYRYLYLLHDFWLWAESYKEC